MGNCCTRERKPYYLGKGQKLSGKYEKVSMSPIPSEKVSNQEFVEDQKTKDINRQKVLEATEKRLRGASYRGSQNGEGKLSQKLQQVKTKKRSDYAREEYLFKQMEDTMMWKAD